MNNLKSFPALYNRTSGNIAVLSTELFFTSRDQSIKFSIPLSSLDIKIQGQNSHHFELVNKFDPTQSVTVQDINVIRAIASIGHLTSANVLKKYRSSSWKKKTLYASPLIVIIAFLILLPLTLKLTPSAWLNQLVTPKAEEKYIERYLWPMMKNNFDIVVDEKSKLLIKDLADKLIAANPELAPFNWKFEVNSSLEVNAFSLPGARLIFNKGLLAQANNCSEILGVLAHEMAHTEQRHVLKSLTESAGVLVATIVLGFFIGLDNAASLVKVSNFVNLKYSRDDETQADLYGLKYINNAGYSAEGMITFFDKLSKDSVIPKQLSFLSTHPHASDRIERLKSISSKYLPPIECNN